ncbi:14-3-3 protein [Ditylenchus destructor]|nr:14-3-3 protein [Ditylenchus destructor]
MATKDQIVYRAKLAEQADRHDDMAKFMLQAIELDANISDEERNLLSFAFKNTVGTRRNSWRMVSSLEAKPDIEDDKKELIKAYRADIELELREICSKVLDILEKNLLPRADIPDIKVFYIKMKADYLRYIAEVSSGDERQAVVEKSRHAYGEAFDIAKEKLRPIHPIRLGLALNFSVFYYEIDSDPKKACQLAKQAFDEALAQMDTVDGETHKDSSMILQLLRDNLSLWTADNDEQQQEGATELHGL